MENASLFDGVIGHERAKRLLGFALERPQHGYVLTGPDGVGVHPIAERFVRGLADEYNGESLTAHPDIIVLEREMNDRGTGLKKEISVEAVRELRIRVSQRPTVAARLVVYIPDADHLNEEGVNALLKCIEEPMVPTTYVFAAHAAGKLPGTLLSRLCLIRLDRVSPSQIEAWLIKVGVSAFQAKRAAEQCDGKPGYARRMIDDPEYQAFVDQVDTSMAHLMRATTEGEAVAAIASVASMCDGGDDPVAEWRNAIQLWQSALRRTEGANTARKHAIGRALIAAERSLGSSIPPRLWLELGLVQGFNQQRIPSFQIPKPFPFQMRA